MTDLVNAASEREVADPAVTDGVRWWVPRNRWDLVADRRVLDHSATVAVIVAYFEQAESLQRMYAAVAASVIDRTRHELIVVDDGSSTPPPEPPPDFPLPVRILRQADEGCRPAAARNLGSASTDAEVLVFFDADTLPEPRTIAQLASWAALLPDALVAGCRHHADLRGWTPERTAAWLTGIGSPPTIGNDPQWLSQGYERSRNLLDADERSYRFVISGVMACNRSLFDDIGGFDEKRDEYGAEDWEIANRAYVQGALMVHEPSAVAWHDEPDWTDREVRARLTEQESQTLWLARHVTEPSARSAGVTHEFAETVTTIDFDEPTVLALVESVSVLLRGLPDQSVHILGRVPPAVSAYFAADRRVCCSAPTRSQLLKARCVIEVRRPPDWTAAELRRLRSELLIGDLSSVVHADTATIWNSRAIGRARRARSFGLDEANVLHALFGASQTDIGASLDRRPAGPRDLAELFRRNSLDQPAGGR